MKYLIHLKSENNDTVNLKLGVQVNITLNFKTCNNIHIAANLVQGNNSKQQKIKIGYFMNVYQWLKFNYFSLRSVLTAQFFKIIQFI